MAVGFTRFQIKLYIQLVLAEVNDLKYIYVVRTRKTI